MAEMTAPRQVVCVAGVARSGTSLVGEIFNSHPSVAYRFQPMFAWSLSHCVPGPGASRVEFEAFLSRVRESRDPWVLQTEKRESGALPTFKKGNQRTLVFKTCRYLYSVERMMDVLPAAGLAAVVRDPRGVVNSWLRLPSEFPPGADPREEWRAAGRKNQGDQRNFFGFYKWREATDMFLGLWQKYPSRVEVVEYERLIRGEWDTERLFELAGLAMGEQSRTFLSQIHDRDDPDPYSVYRSPARAGAWRDELDPGIARQIEVLVRGTRLEAFLCD